MLLSSLESWVVSDNVKMTLIWFTLAVCFWLPHSNSIFHSSVWILAFGLRFFNSALGGGCPMNITMFKGWMKSDHCSSSVPLLDTADHHSPAFEGLSPSSQYVCTFEFTTWQLTKSKRVSPWFVRHLQTPSFDNKIASLCALLPDNSHEKCRSQMCWWSAHIDWARLPCSLKIRFMMTVVSCTANSKTQRSWRVLLTPAGPYQALN